MPAVNYARYSTDKQNDLSIEDQVDFNRRYAARESISIIGQPYSDAALSGTTMIGRRGLERMLEDAEQGFFDTVLVENFARLARDDADLPWIRRKLNFLRVRVISTSTGRELDPVNTAIEAFAAQNMRDTSARAARRGMEGVTRRKKIAAGCAFGYAPNPNRTFEKHGAHGRGEHVIDQDAALLIREIFSRFASGESARAIATDLNVRRIPSPRGARMWNASTITGQAARCSGILRNPLYVGVQQFGKTTFLRNPDTGKRVSRVVPKDQWIVVELPDLRIVDPADWEKVQARLEAIAEVRPAYQRKPKHLLTGLLRCGVCGSGMSRKGADKSGRYRIECSSKHENKTCPDPRSFYIDEIESAVLEGLQSDILHPEALAAFAEGYLEEQRRRNASKHIEVEKAERRLSQVAGEKKRLLGLLISGVIEGEDHEAELKRLTAEAKTMTARVEELKVEREETVVSIHPAAVRQMVDSVAKVRALISSGQPVGDSANLVRGVIETVTVTATSAKCRGRRAEYEIEISGPLDRLLKAPATKVSKVGGSRGSSGQI